MKIKKKGGATGKNLNKQVTKVQIFHQKINNIRVDYLNKVIKDIISQKPKFITIEDLNIKGMMKNRHLSKAIAEQNLYSFRTKLLNKSKQNNIELRVVSRFYPSSKTCNKCGLINRDLKLSDRIFECECGYIEDRDLNASYNLRDVEIYTVA